MSIFLKIVYRYFCLHSEIFVLLFLKLTLKLNVRHISISMKAFVIILKINTQTLCVTYFYLNEGYYMILFWICECSKLKLYYIQIQYPISMHETLKATQNSILPLMGNSSSIQI